MDLLEPIADSDDEVFCGPVTARELEITWRKRVAAQQRENSTADSTDEHHRVNTPEDNKENIPEFFHTAGFLIDLYDKIHDSKKSPVHPLQTILDSEDIKFIDEAEEEVSDVASPPNGGAKPPKNLDENEVLYLEDYSIISSDDNEDYKNDLEDIQPLNLTLNKPLMDHKLRSRFLRNGQNKVQPPSDRTCYIGGITPDDALNILAYDNAHLNDHKYTSRSVQFNQHNPQPSEISFCTSGSGTTPKDLTSKPIFTEPCSNAHENSPTSVEPGQNHPERSSERSYIIKNTTPMGVVSKLNFDEEGLGDVEASRYPPIEINPDVVAELLSALGDDSSAHAEEKYSAEMVGSNDKCSVDVVEGVVERKEVGNISFNIDQTENDRCYDFELIQYPVTEKPLPSVGYIPTKEFNGVKDSAQNVSKDIECFVNDCIKTAVDTVEEASWENIEVDTKVVGTSSDPAVDAVNEILMNVSLCNCDESGNQDLNFSVDSIDGPCVKGKLDSTNLSTLNTPEGFDRKESDLAQSQIIEEVITMEDYTCQIMETVTVTDCDNVQSTKDILKINDCKHQPTETDAVKDNRSIRDVSEEVTDRPSTNAINLEGNDGDTPFAKRVDSNHQLATAVSINVPMEQEANVEMICCSPSDNTKVHSDLQSVIETTVKNTSGRLLPEGNDVDSPLPKQVDSNHQLATAVNNNVPMEQEANVEMVRCPPSDNTKVQGDIQSVMEITVKNTSGHLLPKENIPTPRPSPAQRNKIFATPRCLTLPKQRGTPKVEHKTPTFKSLIPCSQAIKTPRRVFESKRFPLSAKKENECKADTPGKPELKSRRVIPSPMPITPRPAKVTTSSAASKTPSRKVPVLRTPETNEISEKSKIPLPKKTLVQPSKLNVDVSKLDKNWSTKLNMSKLNKCKRPPYVMSPSKVNDLLKHSNKPLPKTPVRPTDLPKPLSFPASESKLSTPKSLRKAYADIQSPVAAYIKTYPTPTIHNAKSHAAANDKTPETAKENTDISNVSNVPVTVTSLKPVFCKSSPNHVVLPKTTESKRFPNMGERQAKILLKPLPVVTRYVGRIPTPQDARPPSPSLIPEERSDVVNDVSYAHLPNAGHECMDTSVWKIC